MSIDSLLAHARALREATPDVGERAVLDDHLAVLAAYAARTRWAAATSEPPGGPAPRAYLAALRRHVAATDVGLAAIARHCLRTGELHWPAEAGSTRTYRLAVTRAEPTGRDGTVIELAVPADLRAHLHWQAGQHLSVHLQRGGVDLQRHYSICAPPGALDEGRLRIAVRRVADGLGSPLVASSARRDGVLDVGVPTGEMTWPPPDGAPHAVLLVAAGSGITPLFAIAAQALVDPAARVGLLVVERGPDEVMLGGELDALRRRHGDRLAYAGHWTRGPDGRPDVDSLARRLDALCRRITPTGAAAVPVVYLCGPAAVSMLAESALRSIGSAAAVRTESFTADRPAVQAEGHRPGGTLRVAVDDGERDIDLLPGESLLAAMLRAGVDHPFSCLSGVCRTCRVTVTAGAVGPDAARLPTDGTGVQVLACIAANRPEPDRMS